MKDWILATLRRIKTYSKVVGKSSFLTYGEGLHIGRGTRLWAPDSLSIGRNVYIGKDVHIEANVSVGDYCVVANRVAFIGRHDHDCYAVGFPARFAPWIGDLPSSDPKRKEEIVVEADVWIGYGAVVLTGVHIGRGALVAAASCVTRNVEPYSIVAGNPARKIGNRFTDLEIIEHEQSISRGRFILSERGLRFSVIEPYKD